MIPHPYLMPALKMSLFVNSPTTENIFFPCVRYRYAGFVEIRFLGVLVA